MRITAILLAAFLLLLPVPSAAEGSTGACEMTITTSNTFYNKAGATNSCSGQISGYYIDNQFYISGQYHQAVEYSGQKFTVYLETSQNTKDILTVYTQGKKEPDPPPEPKQPEPDPQPEPTPKPKPEPEPKPESDNTPSKEKETASTKKPVTSHSSTPASTKKQNDAGNTTASSDVTSERVTEEEEDLDTMEPENDEGPEEPSEEEIETNEEEINENSSKEEAKFSTVKIKSTGEKSAGKNETEDENTDEKEIAALGEGDGGEGPSKLLAWSLISLAVFAGGLIAFLYKPLTRFIGNRKYK
ncbi:hypothetical protein ACQ0QQ_17655 [Lysinibacillus sphaericus]